MDFSKKNFRTVLIVSLVLSLLIYYGHRRFFYSKAKARYEELSGEYEKAKTSLEQLKTRAQNIELVRKELDSLNAIWSRISSSLPSKKEVQRWVYEIADAARRAGMEIILFKPGMPIQKDMYKEYPIQIKVLGGYHELGNFVSFLSNFKRLTKVKDIKIKENMDKKEGATLVEAEIYVSTYVFSPAPPTKKNKKGGKKK